MQTLQYCLYQKAHNDLTHVKSSESLWESTFFHLQQSPSFPTAATWVLTSNKNYGNNWKCNKKTTVQQLVVMEGLPDTVFQDFFYF